MVLRTFINILSLFLLYAAFTVIALKRVLIDRTHSFLSLYDVSIQTFAWLSHNIHALRNYELPLWDFTAYAGVSHVGEMQTGAFYPLQLLLLVFGEPLRTSIVDSYLALHFVLAATLMHLFLASAGLRTPSAIVGSLLFAFIGNVAARASNQPNLYTGLIWVPLCLLCFQRAVQGKSFAQVVVWSLGAGFGLGVMILAGHMEAYIHSGLALLLWAVVLVACRQAGSRRALASFLLGTGSSVLVALPQLIASREYFTRAYKWYGAGFTKYPHVVPWDEFNRFAIPWSDFSTFFHFSDRNFGEQGTLFASFTGLVLVGITTLAYCFPSLRKRLSQGPLFLYGLTLTAAGIVIALGWHTPFGWIIYKTPLLNVSRIPARALFLETLGMSIAAATALQALSGSLVHRAKARALAAVVVLLIAMESIVSARGLAAAPTPLSPDSYYSAQANQALRELEAQARTTMPIYRFVVRPDDLLPPNIGSREQLFSVLGHRSSEPVTYFEFLQRAENLNSPVWDQLGVRFVVSNKAIPELQNPSSTGEPFSYVRPSSLSVLWTFDGVGHMEPARVRHVLWKTNHVTFDIDTDEVTRLVFSQPFYPGWNVSVDGKRRALQQEDIFSAVTVPSSGAHTVHFWYSPPWLWPSMGGPLLFIILLAGCLFRLRSRPTGLDN